MGSDNVQRQRAGGSYVWAIAVLVCLFATPTQSSPVTGNVAVTAVELLTAFSGESATQYSPLFEFSADTRIVAVEIHAVATNATTAQYSGQEHAWREVNNILRIKTADGFEGLSGVDAYYKDEFSDALLLELRGAVAELVALPSQDPVVVGAMLARTRPELSDAARSSIDIALWDLAARRAGLPLYQLLGAKRDSIEPYASLPFYKTLPEYIDAVHRYAKLGYTTFKFHVWGLIEEDLRLVALVQQSFANSDYRFMFDLEGQYNFEEALRIGEAMDKGLFLWLEAPIDDNLLEQYAQLRRQLSVSLIPAGYIRYSADFIRAGIKSAAWDAGRFDVTVVGGISQALELMMIANDADLPIEIQSWGYSLTQAANLHLMLANKRTVYFEAPMPNEAFEFGSKNGSLLEQGRVVAPAGPGLGIEVDWDRLPRADYHVETTWRHDATGQ